MEFITANTFGANSLKFSEDELDALVRAAIENARTAIGDLEDKYVALDIGPTGRLLRPLGDFDFEEAVEVFAKTVRLGAKYGADLIILETFSDSYETKAAVLAAKENCDLPIIVTNAYGADGKLMTGATPSAMVAMLEGMGVDAVINKKLSTAGRIFRFTLSNKVRSIKCLNGSDAEVLEFIVDTAVEYSLGARGLRSICEAIMLDAMYEAPSGRKKTLKIDLPYAKEKVAKFTGALILN